MGNFEVPDRESACHTENDGRCYREIRKNSEEHYQDPSGKRIAHPQERETQWRLGSPRIKPESDNQLKLTLFLLYKVPLNG